MKKALLFTFLFCSILAKSNVIQVTSTADSGPGTLRYALETLAISGDTVLINIKGEILLTSSITLNSKSNITIIGPSPKHCSVRNGSGFTSGVTLFQLSSCANIKFQHFGFVGNSAVNLRAITASNSSLIFERMLFKDFVSTGDGSVFNISGSTINIYACSFIDNTAQRATLSFNNCTASLENTTFWGNHANNQAGVLYIENGTNLALTHNTIYQNSSQSPSGVCVAAGTINNITFKGNLIAENTVVSGGINQFGGNTTYSSGGGNIYMSNGGGDVPFWTGTTGDITNTSFTFNLSTSIWTDGYGLMYFPIVGLGSDLIDVDTDISSSLPPFDCRNAPRELKSTSGASAFADAGACEYTPLRVTNISGSAGTANSLPWALDAINQGYNLVNFIEFDIPGSGPHIIEPTAVLIIDENYIIDGYSQSGSMVPGPGDGVLPGVTPAILPIVINDGGSVSNGFQVSAPSTDSKISGVRITNFDNNGILLNGTNTVISGCEIFTNGGAGINVAGIGSTIGGKNHWNRNVISGNSTSATFPNSNVYISAVNNTKIYNNIIGLQGNGMTAFATNPLYGIFNQGNNTVIGHPYAGNVISSLNTGVVCEDCQDMFLQSNIIGLACDGLTVRSNVTGVILQGTTSDDVTIGGTGTKQGNIISGNSAAQIYVASSSDVNIAGNFIGPDKTGDAVPAITTTHGVYVDHIGATNVTIGGTTADHRNIISGNENGINILNIGTGCQILNNYIGLESNGNNALGNTVCGIRIQPTVTNIVTIGGAGDGNVISGQSLSFGYGIHVSGTANHLIRGNTIGLNAEATAAIPNLIGIHLDGTTDVSIGGNFGTTQANIISGNNQVGILVNNGATNSLIVGNKIGVDSTGTGAIANGTYGIEVGDATNTQIGGSGNLKNQIAGHALPGMGGIILKNTGSLTLVLGNYIGSDILGTVAIPNDYGIIVQDSHMAIIGGATNAENYILGSLSAGILENSTANCTIDGNYIGVNGAITTLGNKYGIHINAANATIGGANTTVIGNNTLHGIYVEGDIAANVTINKTIIGTNVAGTLDLGNTGDGIYIFEADDVEIGVTTGNTIIGNQAAGIRVTGSANIATGTTIQQNTIAGTGLSNQIGIFLHTGSSGTIIGGTYGTSGNTIGNNIEEGILIENSNNNSIYGNRIGNNGTFALPNKIGIRVFNSSNILIGDAGQQNIISGNTSGGTTSAGIILENANGTIIHANLIGVNESGNGALSNYDGIRVLSGCVGTIIGELSSTTFSNTISANTHYGISIESSGTEVMKNFVGTTTGGTGALGFQDYGIVLNPGATACKIGGDQLTKGNIIASNGTGGILILEAGSNEIYGNTIGVTQTFAAVGGQLMGIEISGAAATGNLIGSVPSGPNDFGNIIMNHPVAGVRIHSDAHTNLLSGNYIGISPTNVVGTQNVGAEVLSSAGIDNQIGDDVIDGGNRISGNGTGIYLNGSVHTFIYNNRIGTSVDGLLSNPNTSNGIHLLDAGFNTIGGDGLKSNIISGNTMNGIFMEGSGTTSNSVAGNIIGSNSGLAAAIPNGIGIHLTNGADANFIGQTGALFGNTICGNATGIVVGASDGNLIINNKIGLPFANVHGLVIQNGSTGNIVGGTPAEQNTISNNDSIGVAINGSSNNTISGNFIGTNAAGNLPAGNKIGIYLNGSDFNEIGNETHFNLISANVIAGIIAENSASNTFENNYIGTDFTGDAIFAGSANGVGIALKNSNTNFIGGDNSLNEENIICNSSAFGIYLENSDQNEIYGNHVGINKSGTTYLPNTAAGIRFTAGSDDNLVGSTTAGHSNAIGGNAKGLYVTGSNGNQISSNFIGNNLNGTAVLSGTNNQQTGIHIDSTSALNIISEANVISGNLTNGILITGAETKNNVIRGNFIGMDAGGNVSLANVVSNIVIADSAKLNLVGGSTVLERNYIGGNAQNQVVIDDKADSNQVAGNYIGLGQDAVTTYTSDAGVVISGGSKFNTIGGGFAGEGNTLVGFAEDGIRITGSNKTSILGNRIGIKPDNSPGVIGNAGVKFEGADNNWIGSYLVGSDSANIITNCNTGVAVTTFGSGSYGNFISGNAIYNNTNQGIDIHGDGLVEDIDTNNFNFGNNGEIDRPEIVSAWNCSNGNTSVGFKFFSSNNLPGYHVGFYRNPTPDGSGYGEGEIYLGDFVFDPVTNYDTISVDLGITLPVGTVLTATITGLFKNTSEFSQQFVVTTPPALTAPITTDETCLNGDNGTVTWTATEAYSFSTDGGTTWVYTPATYTATLPTAAYTLDARYLNGCIQSESIVLNPGPPLPFSVVVTPDTCGLSLGEILIDTVSTNLAGGSGDYIYTFNGGLYYDGAIDTLSVDGGIFNIGLLDTTLGCISNIDAIVVPEITEVEDESFVFDSFCPGVTPVPSSVATPGGTFSFESAPGDGATIDGVTGLISSPVIGNPPYVVIYTVGICAEKDTISVSALASDIATFTMDDFCAGSAQNIVITGLAGGTFSFDPAPSDGAVIDPSTGEITGVAGSTYTVKYVTNGACPDSTTVSVNVLAIPAAPSILATDSLYCPGELIADLSVAAGSDTPTWTFGSATSSATVFTPSVLTTGDNYIYVTLTDALNCESAADSINYYLSDTSAMAAGADMETCPGSRIQLSASGGVDYFWMQNDDLTDLTISAPTATIDGEDDYIVTITNMDGCTRTDTLRVTLLSLEECHVETFNAFSPNGDGRNDYWQIDGIEGYPQNTVTIFNRWGDIMVRLENYDNTTVRWDGYNSNNKLVPSGTYYFVVDVNGDQNQSGWVQVVH